jgi:hypothetical protein
MSGEETRFEGRLRMYARVVTAQLKPGTVEEAARIYQDCVAPAAAQTQGNDGIILLVNPKTSAVISSPYGAPKITWR